MLVNFDNQMLSGRCIHYWKHCSFSLDIQHAYSSTNFPKLHAIVSAGRFEQRGAWSPVDKRSRLVQHSHQPSYELCIFEAFLHRITHHYWSVSRFSRQGVGIEETNNERSQCTSDAIKSDLMNIYLATNLVRVLFGTDDRYIFSPVAWKSVSFSISWSVSGIKDPDVRSFRSSRPSHLRVLRK